MTNQAKTDNQAKNGWGFDRLARYKMEHERQGDFAILSDEPGRKSYLCTHPDAVAQILTEGDKRFRRAPQFIETMRRMTGEGLITSEDDSWKSQRTVIEIGFSEERYEEMIRATASAVNIVNNEWSGAAFETNLHEQMQRLSYLSIMEFMFGADKGTEVFDYKSTMVEALIELSTAVDRYNRGLPQNPEVFSTSFIKMDDALGLIVTRRMSGTKPTGDFLSHLIESYTSSDRRCNWTRVFDELKTLLIVGNQSVASGLSWLFYLLDRHPAVKQKYLEEISSLAKSRSVSLNELESLRFSRAILQETLRLYPPVWSVDRVATSDEIVSGRTVEAGSHVVVCQWLTHRHKDFWEHPERFNPDRFLDSSQPLSHEYAYFPYGGGRRACVVEKFAELQMMTAMVILGQAFEIEFVSQTEIDAVGSFVLVPEDDMQVRITKR